MDNMSQKEAARIIVVVVMFFAIGLAFSMLLISIPVWLFQAVVIGVVIAAFFTAFQKG